MKILIATIALVAFSVTAHAQPTTQRFRNISVFAATAVASTGTATSSVISLDDCHRIEALVITASSSSGTADVKLEWMGCFNGTCEDAGNHTDILSATSTTDFSNTAESVHHVAHPTHLSQDIKYTLTGVNSNPADTVVTMDLLCRNN